MRRLGRHHIEMNGFYNFISILAGNNCAKYKGCPGICKKNIFCDGKNFEVRHCHNTVVLKKQQSSGYSNDTYLKFPLKYSKCFSFPGDFLYYYSCKYQLVI